MTALLQLSSHVLFSGRHWALLCNAAATVDRGADLERRGGPSKSLAIPAKNSAAGGRRS